MGRRRQGNLDLMASLPWPVGMATGLVLYWVIRHGVGLYFGNSGSGALAGLGEQLDSGMLAPLAWVALLACWAAALVSFLKSRQRRQLLDSRGELESISSVDWRQFEMLAGEAFRRQGYSVEETGLGGADGGIDLVLRKDGRKTLVQCKQWRRRQVDVATVREMWGLASHHGADAVKIVSSGNYTVDAARFAVGKPIELISGAGLLKMIRAVQTVDARQGVPAQMEPTLKPIIPMPADGCPRCGESMVRRTNRSTNSAFLGCSGYPACKGTRTV